MTVELDAINQKISRSLPMKEADYQVLIKSWKVPALTRRSEMAWQYKEMMPRTIRRKRGRLLTDGFRNWDSEQKKNIIKKNSVTTCAAPKLIASGPFCVFLRVTV